MTTAAGSISDKQRRRIAGALFFIAAFTVIFWVVWYADRELLASNARPAYYEFENAFPLADAWLALAAALAGVELRRRRATALLWLITAGSSAIYLAGMDILYDIEHSIWWASGAGGYIEAGINIVCLVGGTWSMQWAWKHREELLHPAVPQRL